MNIPFSFPKTSALLPERSSSALRSRDNLEVQMSGHSSSFTLISLGEALSAAPAEQEQDTQ